MKISKSQIQNYIPQREPFIMVDNLLDATSEKFQTDFFIDKTNIFLENGILREFALIENIAQSGTIGIVVSAIRNGNKPAEGFIGAITKLRLYDLPKVNDTIRTIVTLVCKFETMYLIKGENYLGDKLLLECEMKLVGR